MLILIKASFPQTTFALIISPSRELATQTFEVAEKLGSLVPKVKIQCLIGGHSREDDINKLEDLKNVIIGTPGRVIDLIDEKAKIEKDSFSLKLERKDLKAELDLKVKRI